MPASIWLAAWQSLVLFEQDEQILRNCTHRAWQPSRNIKDQASGESWDTHGRRRRDVHLHLLVVVHLHIQINVSEQSDQAYTWALTVHGSTCFQRKNRESLPFKAVFFLGIVEAWRINPRG
jgi:hypothetical protein